MNEVAWCYLEGFGCKKDKVRCPPHAKVIRPATNNACLSLETDIVISDHTEVHISRDGNRFEEKAS